MFYVDVDVKISQFEGREITNVSSVVLVFKNIWERCMDKNCDLVNLLAVVCKVFEKLVNNKFVDHLENWPSF